MTTTPPPTAAPSATRRRNRSDDRGEGVISTAIAVLVMAFLGAAMWVAFESIFSDTTANTENQVQIIGDGAAAGQG